MQKKVTRTATGDTDDIIIDAGQRLTFAAKGTGATNYVATAQVQLTDGGNWFAVQTLTDSEVYSTVSGARKLKFNISSLGGASAVDFEVTGAEV